MNTPKTKQQMIAWIALTLNRPPFPISPRESLINGFEPKGPAFYDGRYYKPLKWKQYQHWETFEQKTKEQLIKKWHQDSRIEGVSTLGGWNGQHWLGWVDVDAKSQCWESEPEPQILCEKDVIQHLEQYPILQDCPRFRTPSGGYRLLIAFNREPENFKANSGFSFSPAGSRKGELLAKNGGHTLLPPAVGTNGNPYSWEFFTDYPPVVERPEEVGLFPVTGKTARQELSAKPQRKTEANERRKAFLYAFIANDCLPRLNWEQIYAENIGNFQSVGNEVKGSCPLPDCTHPNQTGTAFSVNTKDNNWYCFGCGLGGSPIQFLDRMLGGDGRNQTLEQLEQIAAEFARRAQVALPELRWKQKPPLHQQSSSARTSAVNNHQQTKSQNSVEVLKQQIRHFLNTVPSNLELTSKIIEWSDEFGRSTSLIRNLVKVVSETWEQEESRSERAQELKGLIQIQHNQISLTDYLPALTPLSQVAAWLGVTDAAMLTTLFPIIASLLKVGSQLELIEATDFSALPILYTGLVAESGSGKSPAQKVLLRPLFRLQAEAEQDYQKALAIWQQRCQVAKDNGEAPPPQPTPREYFVTDATREAIIQIQAHQPERGFLGWFDELSGLIRGQNQYRNGRGTDKEALLSGRDGSAQKVNRACGKRLFVQQAAYSLTCSIQPDTLRALMGDFSDPSGQWARFLWCVLPLKQALFPDDAIPNNFSELLYRMYRRLATFPPQTYRLTSEARHLYRDWYNQLDHWRLVEPKQALRAVYQKMKGDVGVLALLLHCANAATQDELPEDSVSAERLAGTIELSKFYLGQVRLIHSEGNAAAG